MDYKEEMKTLLYSSPSAVPDLVPERFVALLSLVFIPKGALGYQTYGGVHQIFWGQNFLAVVDIKRF